QSLTSSESVVKRPSELVTVSCTVSGFSMGSYYMHWMRQKPGKELEWIGQIDGGTGTIFAQSIQGQFTITKDRQNLQTEDTAVYYCARRPHGFCGAMGNDASWVTVVDVCRGSLVRARVWVRGRSKVILLHKSLFYKSQVRLKS
uniref:Ig-like domain-containing protein n=1 Tax=Oncorhynchus mykiss TaxID=8022 RepID=A0A8K9WUR9_ONCMY